MLCNNLFVMNIKCPCTIFFCDQLIGFNASVRSNQVVKWALEQDIDPQGRLRAVVLALISKINLTKSVMYANKIPKKRTKSKNTKIKSVETQGEIGCLGIESL